MNTELISLSVAAILTILCFTYLYKDNVVFRFLQETDVGLGAAPIAVYGVRVIATKVVPGMTSGSPPVVFASVMGAILGLLVFTKFSRRYRFLSRWAPALLLGLGTGITLAGYAETQVSRQIRAVVTQRFIGVDAFSFFNSLIIVVLGISVLMYFVFTWERRGLLVPISKIGRYALMIAFGASFGSTVTGRFGVLIARFIAILYDWLYPLLWIPAP